MKAFRTVHDFGVYCYYECKDKGQGCRLTCKVVEQLAKLHPNWFGKSNGDCPKLIKDGFMCGRFPQSRCMEVINTEGCMWGKEK